MFDNQKAVDSCRSIRGERERGGEGEEKGGDRWEGQVERGGGSRSTLSVLHGQKSSSLLSCGNGQFVFSRTKTFLKLFPSL